MSIERHFTPPQAAKPLQLDPDYLRDEIRAGRLRAVQLGRGTKRPRYRIPESAIQEWLKGREVQPPAPKPRRKRKERPEVDYVAMMRLGGDS